MEENIINHIAEEMRQGKLFKSPHLCAEYRARLAGELSFILGQLEDILVKKPAQWNAARKDFKSDTACEKWWEATEMGINEMGLRLREKRCEKLMTGLNGLIRIAESESKNNF